MGFVFLTLKIIVFFCLFVCRFVVIRERKRVFNMLNLVILYELPLLIMEQKEGKLHKFRLGLGLLNNEDIIILV